jgi:FkbM family methyltransferase
MRVNSKNIQVFTKYLGSDFLRAVDLGADGGICDYWHPYLKAMRVDAFEPNAKECARQAAKSLPEIEWHPIGLAKTTGNHTLYVPKRTTGASLYPPNTEFMEKFGDTAYWGTIREIPIECSSFSDFLRKKNKKAPNLIKLDTQGSELDILSSLEDLDFKDVLCVETEVEFLEIYKGQPLFKDIHEFMTKKGFELLDLRTARCHFSKNGSEGFYLRNLGAYRANPSIAAQLVAGDALYIRKLDDPSLYQSKSVFTKLILIACIYHFFDLALWLIDQAEKKNFLTPTEREELAGAVMDCSPKLRLRDQRNFLGSMTRTLRSTFGFSDGMDIYWMKRDWPNL